MRPLKQEHFINPILYVEYEHKNGADKILKEGEGHDVEADFLTPNAVARQERINELELRFSPAPSRAGTLRKTRWQLVSFIKSLGTASTNDDRGALSP